jgi:hypothetical protein
MIYVPVGALGKDGLKSVCACALYHVYELSRVKYDLQASERRSGPEFRGRSNGGEVLKDRTSSCTGADAGILGCTDRTRRRLRGEVGCLLGVGSEKERDEGEKMEEDDTGHGGR